MLDKYFDAGFITEEEYLAYGIEGEPCEGYGENEEGETK